MHEPFLRHAQAVVVHLDDGVGVADVRLDRDAPAADLAREPVLDRVLDERLQDHARHDHVERLRRDLLVDAELRPEADDLDREVLVDRLELLAQRDEVIRAAHQPPQQPGELRDQHARRLGLRPDQRRDRRERVEEEVRVDLVGERLDLRGEQQRLLLLQPVLDARVVPDLDRRRDGEHRREQHREEEARRRRRAVEEEQPVVIAPAQADDLPQELERHRREQQHDLPVHVERAEHRPDAPRQAREYERREVPDRFLRAQLPQPAAGKAAADGEGQRAPLADAERRDPDHDADRRARVRAGDEPREKRSLEREVGGVVVQEQPRDDARRQRDAEAEGERHPIGQRAPLEDQDVAEAPVADEHRRQRRHHRELEDERRQKARIHRQLRAWHDLH